MLPDNHNLHIGNDLRIYHVSERGDINLFSPRPSPSHFDAINGDVVFGITEKLLHNYLLPRDCPRVTYYTGDGTSNHDKERFMAGTTAEYVITVESDWYQRIKETTLYCYELPADAFTLLDDCAGYYVSYEPVTPISTRIVPDIMVELLSRNIELRFTPSLIKLVDLVSQSSLNFSLIRMRNAKRLTAKPR